jgi:lysophospholipase L1-like esterase
MKKLAALFVLALLTCVAVLGLSIKTQLDKAASDDPLVWEEDIVALQALDKNQAPDNAVLFVGSSSIRLWHSLAEDMAPIQVIQRGFGGSRTNDLVFYADRIVTPYDVKAIVIFIGTNDINVSDQPMEAVKNIEAGMASLMATIRETHPDTDVFYIAITPTFLSWEKWDAVQVANATVAALMAADPQAHFIETSDLFLEENGQPNKKLYQFDGLHLSEEGYERWTSRIKPLLLEVVSSPSRP